MKQCAVCGKTYDNDRAMICGNCGTPLISIQMTNQNMGMPYQNNYNQSYPNQNMGTGYGQFLMQQPVMTQVPKAA